MPKQTIVEWLEQLTNTHTSSDADSEKMENLLVRIGFSRAICTCGIAYLQGHGTFDTPPTDIHLLAKQLLILIRRADDEMDRLPKLERYLGDD